MKKTILYILAIALIFSVQTSWTTDENKNSDQNSNTNKNYNSIRDAKRAAELALELKERQIELAEDYLYILEQLELVTVDYSKYFKKYEDKISSDYRDALKEIHLNLVEGKYHKNVALLKEDIKLYQKEFKQFMIEVRKNRNLKKLQYVTENLQEEFVNIEELMENDFNYNFVSKQQLQLMEKILGERHKYIMAKYSHDSSRTFPFEVFSDGNFDFNFELKFIESDSSTEPIIVVVAEGNVAPTPTLITVGPVQPVAPVDPITFIVPTHPNPDRPPKPSKPSKYKYEVSQDDDRFYLSREITATNDNISSNKLIIVDCPLGNIEIFGTKQQRISIEADVEVTSPTEKNARKVIESIDIIIFGKGNKLYVECIVPTIRFAETHISKFSATVYVPSGNELICNNSYGNLDINDMTSNISIATKHSNVTIDNSVGNISSTNTRGSTKIYNSVGDINLNNTYSLTHIYNCKGEIEIANVFSNCKLVSNEGTTEIYGSGDITVKDHNGDVNIRNKNGEVIIDNINGDLIARNNFALLSANALNGDATLENNCGIITASNISGRLNALNSSAPIIASGYIGSLSLENNRGEISVSIIKDFIENSTIISTDGKVNITLIDGLNFYFETSSLGGDVTSFVPLVITDINNRKKATYKFGDGGNKMKILSDNSLIVLSSR